MKYKQNRVRVGTMMHPEVIRMCDNNIKNTSCLSRNDFIQDAILFYVGYLNDKENKYLSESIETLIRSNIQITEDRLAKILFKLAVELSMTMNVVAATSNVDNDTLEQLRLKCINDVKQSIGNVSFDDITKYQNG